MSEEEFIKKAQEMGYDDELIQEIINDHNNKEFVLPYEEYLVGYFDNYPI